MFHKHTYHLDKKEESPKYIVFKFICSGCGHPQTKIVEIGSGFDFKVE